MKELPFGRRPRIGEGHFAERTGEPRLFDDERAVGRAALTIICSGRKQPSASAVVPSHWRSSAGESQLAGPSRAASSRLRGA